LAPEPVDHERTALLGDDITDEDRVTEGALGAAALDAGSERAERDADAASIAGVVAPGALHTPVDEAAVADIADFSASERDAVRGAVSATTIETVLAIARDSRRHADVGRKAVQSEVARPMQGSLSLPRG
jgi:hypothetical protein